MKSHKNMKELLEFLMILFNIIRVISLFEPIKTRKYHFYKNVFYKESK
jgi:hypothetical protein